jgi:hypothetical protein
MSPTVSEHAPVDWPPISAEIWDMKYRLKTADGASGEATFADTVARVAGAVAGAEKPELRAAWAERYRDALGARAFLPGGRILAGAGAVSRMISVPSSMASKRQPARCKPVAGSAMIFRR